MNKFNFEKTNIKNWENDSVKDEGHFLYEEDGRMCDVNVKQITNSILEISWSDELEDGSYNSGKYKISGIKDNLQASKILTSVCIDVVENGARVEVISKKYKVRIKELR